MSFFYVFMISEHELINNNNLNNKCISFKKIDNENYKLKINWRKIQMGFKYDKR